MSKELDNLSDSEVEKKLEDSSGRFVRTYNDVMKHELQRMNEIVRENTESVRIAKEFHSAYSARDANRDIRRADAKRFWQGNKEIILVSMLGFGILAFVAFSVHKRNKVNKQVQEYEKTLPGYLEQKQNVAHYRDSLMNVKGK